MAHTGDKVPHDAWDERFEHPARTWASASHRAFTLQATGVAMANATYMFMRENSRFEMMRAVGAKAVASVEMAVPPTMVAGEQSVEISEGETSGEDYCDGDYSDIDDRRLTTPSHPRLWVSQVSAGTPPGRWPVPKEDALVTTVNTPLPLLLLPPARLTIASHNIFLRTLKRG